MSPGFEVKAPAPVWPRALSAIAALTLVVADCVWADSLRCGRKVVKSGDSPAALLRHCGEPLYRATAQAELETGDGRRSVRVERWHYKLKQRGLEHIVLIYRGEIVAVETGRR